VLNEKNLLALQKTGPQIQIQPTSNSENKDDISVSQFGNQKRRGRKRERDDYYFLKAVRKIDEIREKLKTAKDDGLTVKERQRLRNQVSAQQSRIKKKEEVLFLNAAVKIKDQKFEQLVDILTKKLKPKDLLEIKQEVKDAWNFEEVVQEQPKPVIQDPLEATTQSYDYMNK